MRTLAFVLLLAAPAAAQPMAEAHFSSADYDVDEGQTAELTVVRTDDAFEIAKSVWLDWEQTEKLTVGGLDEEGLLWLPQRETTVEVVAHADEDTVDDVFEFKLRTRGGVEIVSPDVARLTVRDQQTLPVVPAAGLAVGLLLMVLARRRAVRR